MRYVCGIGINDWTHGRKKNWTSYEKRVYQCWESMLRRCYDTNAASYKNYGAVGVTVDPSWFRLSIFENEIRNLPGYDNWANSYDIVWNLDKDIIHPGNKIYSNEHCSFVPKSVNSSDARKRNKNNPNMIQNVLSKNILCVETGIIYKGYGEAASSCGKESYSNIARCCKGILKTAYGYHWEYA